MHEIANLLKQIISFGNQSLAGGLGVLNLFVESLALCNKIVGVLFGFLFQRDFFIQLSEVSSEIIDLKVIDMDSGHSSR